jgi:hypothetical protein
LQCQADSSSPDDAGGWAFSYAMWSGFQMSYIAPKTIGYIHGLICKFLNCNSITLFQSNACNTRALHNEGMILEVLEAEELAVFRQELFNTLVHYYEVILGLPNVGRRPKPKSFKHKMKTAKSRAAEAAGLEYLLKTPLKCSSRRRGGVKQNRQLRWQRPPPPDRQQRKARLPGHCQ